MAQSRFNLLALAGAAAILLWPGVTEARYRGNLNLFVGQKWMTESQWSPVAEQPEIGLMLAFGEERIAYHFSVDAYYSSKEADPLVDTHVKATSGEISIGVRRLWDLGATRPYLGGGASVVTISADFDGPSGRLHLDDRAYGAYFQAGVFWRLAGHLNLGIEARYCKADGELGELSNARDVDAGGFHAGLLIGYGW